MCKMAMIEALLYITILAIKHAGQDYAGVWIYQPHSFRHARRMPIVFHNPLSPSALLRRNVLQSPNSFQAALALINWIIETK